MGEYVISNLSKIQRTARIATNTSKYDHITPVLKELKWLPVVTQLKFRNVIVACKCLKFRLSKYLSSQFIKRGEISRCATRSSPMLNIPLFMTANGQRTFYLTIILRARMGSESIAHEPEGRRARRIIVLVKSN